jgi:GTP pyrophosphokinase
MIALEDILHHLRQLSPSDKQLIQAAYEFAEEAHRPHKRRSGEPYFTHVAAVAHILAELGLDAEAVAAGLLHDVVEDTPIRLREIRQRFGPEVAKMVDGVTKMDDLEAEDEGQVKKMSEAEYLQKTISAMNHDVRVILIKLADRLHNMRTLAAMSRHRQIEIAEETLQLFAPLASRLGIWKIKSELEQLCFQYIDPVAFERLSQEAAASDDKLQAFFEKAAQSLELALQAQHIPATVKRHMRNLYTIHQEMQQRSVNFEDTFGVRSIRIIVDTVTQCYQTLGLVHQTWRPVPGEVQDYIATPKDNFYQSLHTAVFRDDGQLLRVQIRTHEMEEEALYGIATYWRRGRSSDLQEKLNKRLAFLKALIEPATDEKTPDAFVQMVIENIHSHRVYALTPRGDVIDLPHGATPIDFAYHIHTELGHQCRAARVNGRLVPLDYALLNGDQVEIFSRPNGQPRLEWLNPSLAYVCTPRARSKIKAWFRAQDPLLILEGGRQALDEQLELFGLPAGDYQFLVAATAASDEEGLLLDIGNGTLIAAEVVTAALDRQLTEQPLISSKAYTVPITGAHGYQVRLAQCCLPQAGDDIVGYITREGKVSVHHRNCPSLKERPDLQERLIALAWSALPKPKLLSIPVCIRTLDRRGMMGDIGNLISDEDVNLSKVEVLTDNGLAVFQVIMEVETFARLSRVLTKLRSLEGVLEARRWVK